MNPHIPTTPSAPAGGTGSSGSVSDSGGTLTQTKEKITQTARETAQKVKSVASDTAAKAKGQAERVVDERKESAAEHIHGYSSALHESARRLEEQDPNIAWFTHRAADRLQHVADYVRNSDFGALRHDCEDFARRHPAAFFGGMFLTGLVLGNIVKASTAKAYERHDTMDDTGDMGASMSGMGTAGTATDWTSAGQTTQPEIPTGTPSMGM